MQNDVAATARTTASIRARETARPDGLFRDPLAEVLAGPEAIAALHTMPEPVQDRFSMYTVLRTRVFDDWLAATTGPAHGLLPYLVQDVAIGMLDGISELSPHGSHFAADFVDGVSIITRNQYLAGLRQLSPSLMGAPFQFGIHDPHQLLADHGWTTSVVMHPGDDGANFGRFTGTPGLSNLPLPVLSFVLARRA